MKKGNCVVCGAPFETRWQHQKTCSRRCGNINRSADFDVRKNRYRDIWNSLKVKNRGLYISLILHVSDRTAESWYYVTNRAIPRDKLKRLEAVLCSN